ncbi:MAG: hypothetical protein PHQ93_10705 [Sulfurimonas sp.]|uniref:hypothetical protein n=1 Tax=Sulfurimonas sp. TaxID=2022749 RepID=UPI00261272DE|nr:hypothetical protein [Sulfurimonas sp.]MDD5401640.1 hypothetical protein [Sulfurimonas sp.]
MPNNHQEGFDNEAKFHQALSYMIERHSGVQTSSLKHILGLFNPELLNRLFTRKKCRRSLAYIGKSNDRFKHGSCYQSITFNGASYEVVDMNGEIQIIGSTYFLLQDVIKSKILNTGEYYT